MKGGHLLGFITTFRDKPEVQVNDRVTNKYFVAI